MCPAVIHHSFWAAVDTSVGSVSASPGSTTTPDPYPEKPPPAAPGEAGMVVSQGKVQPGCAGGSVCMTLQSSTRPLYLSLGLKHIREPRPKTPFSPHQLQQQLGHRVLCRYWDAGFGGGECSNLLLFLPLSLPEGFRWGRTAGSHLILKAGHTRGCLRSARLSAGHPKQSSITLAVNDIFHLHLVGVFPAAAWNCRSPSPPWTQPCQEGGLYFPECCPHTDKRSPPPLPLSIYPE